MSENIKLKDHGLLCAQNFTKNITFEKDTISGDTAKLITHHIYEASGDNQIEITLNAIIINGKLLMQNV